MTDPTCLFCKIAAGQIPSFKIYEDDAVVAFLDIGPLVPGHTLVIPKTHYTNVMDATPEVFATIAQRLPKISQAVLAATGTKACHILVNNGTAAQQSISHLHFHILPRAENDTFHIPWNAGTLDKGAAPTLAASIARNMVS